MRRLRSTLTPVVEPEAVERAESTLADLGDIPRVELPDALKRLAPNIADAFRRHYGVDKIRSLLREAGIKVTISEVQDVLVNEGLLSRPSRVPRRPGTPPKTAPPAPPASAPIIPPAAPPERAQAATPAPAPLDTERKTITSHSSAMQAGEL